MIFQFRQCENRECQFRYPTQINAQLIASCPVCGNMTRVVAQISSTPDKHVKKHSATSNTIEALLDNIRSGYNVGSIFRTADGSGISHLHLTGITSTPNQTKVSKTALGAEKNVAWTYHLNGLESIKDLKTRGYRIWAIENNLSGESLFNINIPLRSNAPILIVVGNEIAGIDPGILKLCDRILYLPMLGKKRSLNVVIAFGIVAYYLRFGAQASLL